MTDETKPDITLAEAIESAEDIYEQTFEELFEQFQEQAYEMVVTETLPTCYSSNHAGKKLYWYLELQGDRFRSCTKTGEEGKLKVTGWTVCTPKNVGKSNETTGSEQAKAETLARYEKKLKHHWHLDEDCFLLRHYFEPMLAHKYKGPKDDLWLTNKSVITQPKLDGFRCIIKEDGAWSRKGEKFVSVPHIREALQPLFDKAPKAVLDGELYNHEFNDNFNELTSIIRKEKPTEEDLAKSREFIQFHVYDLPSVGNEDYLERYESLRFLMGQFPTEFVHVVETNVADNHKQVRTFLEDYLQRGYEGLMVRLDKEYVIEDSDPKKRKNYRGYEVGRRSPSLLKYKLFIDEEFKLIAINPGLGSWSEYAKSLTIELEDGTHCDSGVKGDFAFTKKLLENKEKYIGKQVTVKYFTRTPDNKPRFPVAIKFHLKEKA